MGEEVRGVPEATALEVAQSAQDACEGKPEASVGVYLAQQRRLRGISLDELSGLTRIPRRSLERLEAGAFDRTTDGFARGFVRSVAEALGLDPDEAVMRLLPEPLGASTRLVGWRSHPVLILGTLAAIVLGAAAWGLWNLRGEPEPVAAPAVEPPPLYRRDAVRELAVESRQDGDEEPPADR